MMPVNVSLDPALIEAEVLFEWYPEALAAAVRAAECLLTPGTRDHRDAGVIAACILSAGLSALVDRSS